MMVRIESTELSEETVSVTSCSGGVFTVSLLLELQAKNKERPISEQKIFSLFIYEN
jgi:hypothetical protein